MRIAAIAVALGVCTPAFAQRPRPERPYRGLFGGNSADPSSTQQFDLNLSVSGAYDDNAFAERAGIDPRYQRSAGYGAANLSLDYTKRAGRATVDLSAGTSYRYYPAIRQLSGFTYFGSVGFVLEFTRRTTLRATESATYTPFFALGVLQGMATTETGNVAPINPGQPLTGQSAFTGYSSAALEHRLTPRASLAADYTFSYTDYQSQPQPFRSWGVGGLFRYRVSRQSTVRLGYHFRRGTSALYQASRPIDAHDVDVGLDYSRALSSSRRTTIGFTTGSSAYRSLERIDPSGSDPGAPGVPIEPLLRNHYAFTGSAYLNRQIGRSWNARVDYRRGLQFVEGFPDPFFSDSVNMTAGGLLGARSRLNFSAAYTNGEIGISVISRRYETYTGVAGYQLALTRWLALFAEYDYFHYRFDPSIELPSGMNRGMNRQSIRGGLNLSLPLLR